MKKFGVLLFLLAGCVDWSTLEKTYVERDVIEKVGVLANLDINWERSTQPMLRALACFQAEGVSRVVILGDPTQNGYPNQRTVFELAWAKAFADVTPPERVMAPAEYEIGGITFTGEGRFPLTDLLCVHPKDGRRVNAGSMHGIVFSGVFDKHDGATVSRMGSSSQGLLVLVREKGLEIRRLDFSHATAEEVGPPWRVDSAGMIEAEAEGVPKFWDDTIVNVTPGYDGRGNQVYTIRWPPVLAQHTGARAFSYDVTVGDKVLRRVQSDGFFLPESRDDAAVKCMILVSELEGSEPRFGITPVSSLGKRGPTVWSR